jgi:hypothetical protein
MQVSDFLVHCPVKGKLSQYVVGDIYIHIMHYCIRYTLSFTQQVIVLSRGGLK